MPVGAVSNKSSSAITPNLEIPVLFIQVSAVALPVMLLAVAGEPLVIEVLPPLTKLKLLKSAVCLVSVSDCVVFTK